MSINTPDKIIDKATAIGRDKIDITLNNLPRLAALSVVAGAFISLGALLSVIVGQGLTGATAANPIAGRLAGALVFPIGLVLIVVLGGELFTGNNALLMPALRRGHYGIASVIYNWTLVWIGNFIGALLFIAIFVWGTGTLDTQPWHSASAAIATSKMSLTWVETLCRGIGANWCVCLAVWLALSSNTLTQKVIACWIPVSAFVILGWEHCVANMFFIPAGMLAGADITLTAFITDNLLPATLGNIIGGALPVGTLYALLHNNKSRFDNKC